MKRIIRLLTLSFIALFAANQALAQRGGLTPQNAFNAAFERYRGNRNDAEFSQALKTFSATGQPTAVNEAKKRVNQTFGSGTAERLLSYTEVVVTRPAAVPGAPVGVPAPRDRVPVSGELALPVSGRLGAPGGPAPAPTADPALYILLGLRVGASDAEILGLKITELNDKAVVKRARDRMLLKWHPDKSKTALSDEEKKERTALVQLINDAYDRITGVATPEPTSPIIPPAPSMPIIPPAPPMPTKLLREKPSVQPKKFPVRVKNESDRDFEKRMAHMREIVQVYKDRSGQLDPVKRADLIENVQRFVDATKNVEIKVREARKIDPGLIPDQLVQEIATLENEIETGVRAIDTQFAALKIPVPQNGGNGPKPLSGKAAEIAAIQINDANAAAQLGKGSKLITEAGNLSIADVAVAENIAAAHEAVKKLDEAIRFVGATSALGSNATNTRDTLKFVYGI